MKLTRVTLATASSVLLLSALAACGSSSDDTATDDSGMSSAAQGGQLNGGPGGGQLPGAFGTVADVNGKTAQVQNDFSGQVAVSWTGDTTFTEEVDATLDDVKVGSCVVVSSDDSEPGATEVTATSVRVMDACDLPSGMPTDRPSDMPTDMPTDMPDGGNRPGGFGTIGEVASVSGDGFTVSGNNGDVTVTVTGDTTYTTTADATASAVKVGVCVNAQGDSDDTGAVNATSIGVSQPVDGQCTGGFGGFQGRPGGAS